MRPFPKSQAGRRRYERGGIVLSQYFLSEHPWHFLLL